MCFCNPKVVAGRYHTFFLNDSGELLYVNNVELNRAVPQKNFPIPTPICTNLSLSQISDIVISERGYSDIVYFMEPAFYLIKIFQSNHNTFTWIDSCTYSSKKYRLCAAANGGCYIIDKKQVEHLHYYQKSLKLNTYNISDVQEIAEITREVVCYRKNNGQVMIKRKNRNYRDIGGIYSNMYSGWGRCCLIQSKKNQSCIINISPRVDNFYKGINLKMGASALLHDLLLDVNGYLFVRGGKNISKILRENPEYRNHHEKDELKDSLNVDEHEIKIGQERSKMRNELDSMSKELYRIRNDILRIRNEPTIMNIIPAKVCSDLRRRQNELVGLCNDMKKDKRLSKQTLAPHYTYSFSGWQKLAEIKELNDIIDKNARIFCGQFTSFILVSTGHLYGCGYDIKFLEDYLNKWRTLPPINFIPGKYSFHAYCVT